jgi:hypothetical protein
MKSYVAGSICQALPIAPVQGHLGYGQWLGALRQGLPLVHFSAQPEPFLSLNSTETTQRVPGIILNLSLKVDECKPLPSAMVAL